MNRYCTRTNLLRVGDAAKNAAHSNPENTVFDTKRLLGRKVDDPDVKRDMKHWPFKVTEKQGKPMITVKYNGEKHDFVCLLPFPCNRFLLFCFQSAEEITAMVLRKLKETAEAYLGEKVTRAVITVPACKYVFLLFLFDFTREILAFNDAQRQATKDAGAIAGLDVLRTINEPTAAAMVYGLNKKGKSQFIVYDLGGGTFDVSLLSIDNGRFKVLATAGDTHLGGEDFNQRVMDYVIELYKKTGTDVTKNLRALGKLKCEVEKAKRILSGQQSTKLEIENFEDSNVFSETLTRAKFEELNMDHFMKTMKFVEQVLKDASVTKEDVDDVCRKAGRFGCSELADARLLVRLSSSVVRLAFQKFDNYLKITLAERSLQRVSTLMKLLSTVLLYRVVS